MKRNARFFAGLVVLLLLTALCTEAMAKTTLTFSVGTKETKTAYRNNGNIVEVTLTSGKLPAGLAWNWDTNRIWVSGTPTKEEKVDLTFTTVEKADGAEKKGTQVITISVESPKLKITKQPTGEKVRAGGSAKFIAKADNAVEMSWHFVSPKGKDYRYSKIKDVFPRLTVKGGMSSTLELGNIPADMNGWSVYCRFYVDKTNFEKSKTATITVTGTSATAVPAAATPEPTAVPEPTAEPVVATPIPTLPPLTVPDGGSGAQGGEGSQGGSGAGTIPVQGTEGTQKNDHTTLFVVAGAAILVVLMLCGTLIVLSKLRENERRERDRERREDDRYYEDDDR